jgi:hypothetical protein
MDDEPRRGTLRGADAAKQASLRSACQSAFQIALKATESVYLLRSCGPLTGLASERGNLAAPNQRSKSGLGQKSRSPHVAKRIASPALDERDEAIPFEEEVAVQINREQVDACSREFLQYSQIGHEFSYIL